jgi:hypothetical protein
MPTEGIIEIRLTTATLPDQLAEVRHKLDRALANFSPPPSGRELVQNLRMISFYPLRYELYLVARTSQEPRTIL